jgi:hypothetical protein
MSFVVSPRLIMGIVVSLTFTANQYAPFSKNEYASIICNPVSAHLLIIKLPP